MPSKLLNTFYLINVILYSIGWVLTLAGAAALGLGGTLWFYIILELLFIVLLSLHLHNNCLANYNLSLFGLLIIILQFSIGGMSSMGVPLKPPAVTVNFGGQTTTVTPPANAAYTAAASASVTMGVGSFFITLVGLQLLVVMGATAESKAAKVAEAKMITAKASSTAQPAPVSKKDNPPV